MFDELANVTQNNMCLIHCILLSIVITVSEQSNVNKNN